MWCVIKNVNDLLHSYDTTVADGSLVSILSNPVTLAMTPIGIELIMLSTCCEWFGTRELVPSAPNVGPRRSDEQNIFDAHTVSPPCLYQWKTMNVRLGAHSTCIFRLDKCTST